MSSKNFQTFFDCGFSKIRAGTFNRNNQNDNYYAESKFLIDRFNIDLEIQQIISYFEKNTNEYIDNVNLMVDSPKMLSVSISISKKINGLKLREENIQFLIQEAKQQIEKNYMNLNISHIIINNYKIDDVNYSYVPDDIKCQHISLDIFFFFLPNDLLLYLKNIFSISNISINQIVCSSYAKSINYKDNLSFTGYASFIDVGFNKTSIISYFDDKILSLDVLPVGGNHITKDISKILEISLEQSEQIKTNLNQNHKHLNGENISADTLQKIIFARTEEILELCTKSIESNSFSLDHFKMILMGEGSKVLDNQNKDRITFTKDIDLLEETLEDICRSGLRLERGLNKQEVVVIPKKQLKHGFFEKLFHFFN